MGRNINMGHLVTTGHLNQKDHGHSRHVKSTGGTGVARPNTQKLRNWEKKLVSAFNTIEVVGRSASVFEGKLLESLCLPEGGPGLKKNGEPKKARPPDEVLADAEQRVLNLEKSLGRANDGIRLAGKEAILPGDKETVNLAREALSDLNAAVQGLAKRVRELKADFGVDSAL